MLGVYEHHNASRQVGVAEAFLEVLPMTISSAVKSSTPFQHSDQI